MKTASKKEIQKTAQATGDLIGNKITDKISVPVKSTQNALKTDENEIEIPKERCISPEKRQQIIVEIGLA